MHVYELKKQPELIKYCHAPAGFPTKPMWIAVIKNTYYVSWPGLAAANTAKYFTESEEM